MDETLSEAGEEMEAGNTPEPKQAEEDFTAQKLKDVSGDDWAETVTPPLTLSPRKNLELPLTSETPNIGMILLIAKEVKRIPSKGTRPCS